VAAAPLRVAAARAWRLVAALRQRVAAGAARAQGRAKAAVPAHTPVPEVRRRAADRLLVRVVAAAVLLH